jgi:hypothetical protein
LANKRRKLVLTPDYNNGASYTDPQMPEESHSQRFRKMQSEVERRRRELMIQLGQRLMKSRGTAISEAHTDRERLAQIEAYKNLILEKTRELQAWTEHRDHAANRGMAKEAKFRQQMITEMEKRLKRYEEEIRNLRSIPGSSWSGST